MAPILLNINVYMLFVIQLTWTRIREQDGALSCFWRDSVVAKLVLEGAVCEMVWKHREVLILLILRS